jgi:RES domain-containing protein
VVYLTDHPALAALKVRVHLDLLPTDYVLMQVDVPEPESIVSGATTVIAGDAWLTTMSSATVQVPSVLVPHAWNLLLNPRHHHAAQAEIRGIEHFRFDPQLRHPLAGEG